ncbi:MAG: s-methyl-5-thioribose-1-phosphate isomerase, partial [Candidatus Heimdallarchaeota archaeon]|nr:s-methyl-5-thioribose-1-phosphate isomerase [Candidatus Heimdallarchaeota archaeon]
TIEECRLIGEHGNQLIKSDYRIMTICNAGALATVDIGTALAPIRKAHSDGKKIIVYVNETRPRMQGARLTAWELYHEDIEHYIITDNSAGHIIKNGLIDLAIVGADRIVLNGDVANKIGTYTLSVLCKENEIPFYVAAPISTFDTTSKSGNDITIEERDGKEVRTALSVNDKQDTKPKRRIIHHSLSPNLNPAFDVTPSKNITGIITPKGILEHPLEKSITKLLEKSK